MSTPDLTEIEAGAVVRTHSGHGRGNCPCCGGPAIQSIYSVRDIPVHSCVLLDTLEDALKFPRRDLDLVFCSDCGFAFNSIFDEAIMGYSTNFEESQHFSGTFNSFAKELARDIAQKAGLKGKHVLEIGCGKGEFLLELCGLDDSTGLGIDPGYREDRVAGKTSGKVDFIVDFFGPAYNELEADIILCRHTLEHICPVRDFVADIRQMVGDRRDVLVFFETPDAERVLAEGAFWDIYYEHCSYFSAGTHARLFRRQGFDVTEVDLVYDRQYIVQYARPAEGVSEPRLPLENDLGRMKELAAAFPGRVTQIQAHWRDLVTSASAEGKHVAIWGGGSKGVSFVTTLGLRTEVRSVVDINPYKQGKFLPGSGHRVIAPQALVDDPPDIVIVMNPVYVDEISEQLRGLGISADVVAV
ncbi:MAG: class I SAM-dependent methyltransferase [Hyphomicrobiales bacterium]|nr:class I SAM-dependent methyltransferase [Hyphomicrobiales bacterium]